jgi:hypothetical protein
MNWHANSFDCHKGASQAEKEFAEWASLFSGSDLFVKIVAYVDESGTHDETGQAKGATEAVLGAVVARIETWQAFCRDWQAVLDQYNAPYFHFTEWSSAAMTARGKKTPDSKYQTNPYRGWSHQTLDRFIIALAKVVGSETDGAKVIYTTAVRTDKFHKLKIDGKIPDFAHPYIWHFKQFFDALFSEINVARPHWRGCPVSFFFDQADSLWMQSASHWFTEKKKSNPLMDSIAFQDKKKYLPLQAADMIAYRMRQKSEDIVNSRPVGVWIDFDAELFRPAFHKPSIPLNELEVDLAIARHFKKWPTRKA